MFDRSAWSVPAGFPEPYPNRRFTSDAEDAVGGVEPEPLLQESILCMVAQKVHQVTSLPPSHLLLPSAKELHQLLLVAASLQFVEERSELLVIEFYPC